MLKVKFLFRGAQVTWEISDVFLFCFFYVLTTSIILILKKIKKSKLNKVPKSLRGGDGDLDPAALMKCVKEDKPFLIGSKKLFEIAKKLLKLKNNTNVIVINRIVFALILLHSNHFVELINRAGVQLLTNNIKTLLLSVTGGVGFSVLVHFFLTVHPILEILAILVIMTGSATLKIGRQPCSNFISELPSVEILTETPLYYIDVPKRSDNLLILNPSEKQELFIKIPEFEKCTVVKEKEELIFADITGEELIYNDAKFRETCTETKAKYVPLKDRTKTLSDIKRGDSTENLEQVYQLLPSDKEKEELAIRLKN